MHWGNYETWTSEENWFTVKDYSDRLKELVKLLHIMDKPKRIYSADERDVTLLLLSYQSVK